MLRRSNLITIFILLFISAICINEFVLAFDDAYEIPEPEKFAEMKLTEELNISGEMLRELVGENPRLSGLKKITAKVYELLDFEWDSHKIESIFEFYRDNLKTQGWQVKFWQIVLREVDKKDATLVLQKDSGHEGLFVVRLTPEELTIIKLIGKFNLGALNELKSALREEWRLNTLLRLSPAEKKPLPQEFFWPSKMTEPRYMSGPVEVEHLEQAIKEGKTDADVYVYLGIAYERSANYAKAQQQYQTILDKFPDASDWILARALYGIGKSSEQLGEIERAKFSYAKFIEKNFDLENYFAPAVESGLIRLQHYDEAVLFSKHEYEKIKLAIAENQLYNEWAYQDAIKTYNSIVTQFPDSPYAASAQFMKGICYRWMNEPQLEITELKKAVEKYPNVAAYYYLAKAYQRQEMYQDALSQYQKIVEYPEANRWYIADADYNIGKCLEGLVRTDEASEHYERFLEKYKNDKEQGYLYSSARIALEYLKRSLDTLPFLGVGLRRIDGKVVVTQVIEGSAAEQAGIQKGDMILSVDEKEIQYPKSVVAAVISKNIGDTIVVTIMRDNQKLDISATLRKK